MSGAARSRALSLGAVALLFLALLAMNLALPGYYLRIVNLIGINIILVASLNLTNGFTGIFSLGHAGFMALGAYSSALLTLPAAQKALSLPDLPPWLAATGAPFPAALLVAGMVAAFAALLIGFPVLRLRGHYLAVATMGFLVIVRVVLVNAESITRGARGISGLPRYTDSWWVYGTAVVVLYLLRRLTTSAYGRGLMAIRDNPAAAESLGIPLARYRLMAFCVGAFFAGVGGALWGHLQSVIAPGFFSYGETFFLVEISIIGGTASLTGAVVGSVIMTLLPELLRNLEGGGSILGLAIPPLYGLSQLILAALLILIIIFRQQGIMGAREFSWSFLARRRAAGKIG
jgi:branched-chain amino acid transport system permease protein